MEFAVVNAKWLDDETGEFDRRNVLVKNGQIVGVGYIPDEDEASLNVIDANGGLIKAHGFDFATRECIISPNINTCLPVKFPRDSCIVNISNNACDGCS